MKKVLVLLLASLLLISLASCGQDANETLVADETKALEYKVTVGDDVFEYEIMTSDTVAITGFKGPYEPHAIVIPSQAEGRTVARIENNAFYYASNITSVTLPNTITSIGEEAFAGCTNLTTFKMSDNIEVIENAAFTGSAITSINFGTQLATIGEHAFHGCTALTSATFTAVKSIGEGAFYGCTKLSAIVLPEGTEEIKDMAFYGCEQLESANVPASVSKIGDFAFNGTPKLTEDKVVCPAGSYAATYFADETKFF